MNIAIDVCLGAMLLFGFFSVLSRHLINAAISLAAVSAACGVLMYVLGAHTAAIFEVSVCSGLVTVIFISAVSLSNGDRQASAQGFWREESGCQEDGGEERSRAEEGCCEESAGQKSCR